ncbi:MAG: hypothetical protein CSH36_01460 [Thalassolituus sp.]|nr:MAG: hypothetical protein CSH36_01460 [Thalassolituus sp.]
MYMPLRVSPLFLPALLLSPLTFAVSTSEFPAQPTITYPSAEETDVSTSATFEGSAFTAVNDSGDSAPGGTLTLLGSQWRFSEVESLTREGGFAATTPLAFDQLPDDVTHVSIPAEAGFRVEGTAVTSMEIRANGTVSLRDELDTELAIINTGISTPDEYAPVATEAILLSLSSIRITIQWYFDALADGAGDVYAQASIFRGFTDGGTEENSAVFIGFGGAELTDPAFSDTTGSIGLSLTSGNSDNRSLDAWTGALAPETTSLLISFAHNNDGIITSSLDEESSIFFATDDEQVFATSDTTDLAASDLLDPATQYYAQVRYSATSSTDSSTRYSPWSEPVAFTTDVQSAYSFGPENEAPLTVLENDITNIKFLLSNTGTDAGEPQVSLRFTLPNAEAELGIFSATLSDQAGSCLTSRTSNEADTDIAITCRVSQLEAGDSIEATLRLRLYSDTDFEYRACETLLNRCSDVEYTAGQVTVIASGDEIDDETESESSGDSGGSTLWLTLLALPLLRLRRKA